MVDIVQNKGYKEIVIRCNRIQNFKQISKTEKPLVNLTGAQSSKLNRAEEKQTDGYIQLLKGETEVLEDEFFTSTAYIR